MDGDLVFALDEDAAVFRQLGAEDLHDRGPRGDRVTGTVADAGGEEAVGDGAVAIEGDLRTAGGDDAFDGFEAVEEVANIILGPGVAGVEREHGVADDVFVFAAETLFDEAGEFLDIEIEDPGDEAHDVDVLALLFAGAADGLDGAAGDRHGDLGEAVVAFDGLDVVRIVEEHAAGAEGADVGVVAVLIKRDEHVGAVAGGENVAGAHAHLEDRGSAGDGGRDRHVGHDVLIAAAREAGEESADGLDAVLGVTGESDDDVVDGTGCGRRSCGATRGFGSVWAYHKGVGRRCGPQKGSQRARG
jgi:hypothetical protein